MNRLPRLKKGRGRASVEGWGRERKTKKSLLSYIYPKERKGGEVGVSGEEGNIFEASSS